MASKKRHMIRGGTDQEDASTLKLGPGRSDYKFIAWFTVINKKILSIKNSKTLNACIFQKFVLF